MINITDKDQDEIIAIQIANQIYFDKEAIKLGRAHVNDIQQLLPRAVFKLMACLDLGPQWQAYSDYPTLFTMTEYDKICENKKEK